MKKYTSIILLYGFFQLLTNFGYSQDNIILKNGDEIKAKVLEVTTDQIKYKKWDNQEGPTYSAEKSDIFMIQYKNGTKDVFNNATSTSNTLNSGDKFIGNWLPKRGDRGGVKERLTISKAGQDYLINYSRIEDAGGGMYINDGSFKETGHIEGSNLVVNSFLKLSLMNDNTILLQSVEFIKSATQKTQSNNTGNQQNQSNNNANSQQTTRNTKKQGYYGESKENKKEGKGTYVFEDLSEYTGDWKNDKREGYGIQNFLINDGKYSGEWKDDKMEGNGIYEWHSKDGELSTFTGIMKNNAIYDGVIITNVKGYGKGKMKVVNGEAGKLKLL